MSYQYQHGGSSPYDHGAPTYNYNPLHQAQAGPYGQQIVPAYPPPVPYAQQPAHGYGSGQQVMPYQGGTHSQHLQAEEHRHRQNEHRAAIGALGAVAFAAYEKREEKADPAHARRHHVEAQVAEAAALGLGGYAIYERHGANKIHKIQKQEAKLSGKQKHKHHK